MNNPFVQPNNWADRKSLEIRTSGSDSKDWKYLGACVDLTGEVVDHITGDDQEEITFVEFWGILGPLIKQVVERALGYSEAEFPIDDDQHVTYWRGKLPVSHSDFPGHEVVFLDHSRIEYVWVRVG